MGYLIYTHCGSIIAGSVAGVGLPEWALHNACLIRYYGFHFPVEVNLEGEGRSVKNAMASVAMRQMALHLAGNLRREASFQIFANQPYCGFTGHVHGSALVGLGVRPNE